MSKVFINGKIIDSRNAEISIFDRGFLYGDGLFESLRTYNCKPFLLDEHLARLFKSARLLKIKIPYSKLKIKNNIARLIKINKFKEAYIKIIVTRGEAKSHGLSTKNVKGKANVIIIIEKLKRSPKKSNWKIITKTTTHSSTIKSLDYLNNILAKTEAEKKGADETILIDPQGYVLEGTVSNIFIVKNGILITPPLSLPILPGVTRQFIMKLARKLKIKVQEKKIKLKDLKNADECFLTFSGEGIVPVINGKITRLLML
ncbi:MAG: aminotransferase class IV [Candidatus Margulisbacteria bacterium]|nr:aminotransferase class IV [Candidatus Margulisiibacteriota bacterium]MBU1021838.1 aminotransferase class IV [Candidatus Margulisiibacteriota bacterium]MBU1728997.1 aminotransferase class IV [Candidatus Margulisiibacteriota bacterium]MBU1954450.1 aminotransferase class IV [Candidatus Margulisiibacteriota bacterium]